MTLIWNLEQERTREAQRRLTMLGDLSQYVQTPQYLPARAHLTTIPKHVLWSWLQAVQSQGVEGLKPNNWMDVATDVVVIIESRYAQLDGIGDNEIIADQDITILSERNGWSRRTATRWLQRYRSGGRWALAPSHDPESISRRQPGKRTPRALATLTESALDEVFRRRDLLGDLGDQATVQDIEMKKRADAVGISSRTLWTYRRDYRQYGLAGLAPRQRTDLKLRVGISKRMVSIVKGIRLSQPDIPVHEVHTQTRAKAQLLGEYAPSVGQVRAICAEIPDFVKELADGREDTFRNRSRITYRFRFGGEVIILQIDHTRVDVLAKDLRQPKSRSKSGEVRPWLTVATVANARLCASRIFSYDQPNRFTVAAAIRDALIMTDHKPYCGLVDEIWVDRGKDLVSRHIQQLVQELGILFQPCAPHQPQIKGIVERFFGTLNTRLWATLPGYVGSNTVVRNPHAKAALSISELATRFDTFIEQYHHETHSELGMTPLQYWSEHCHTTPVDARHLDILLQEPHTRRVIKEGVKYAGRTYWHQELATLVGQDIVVRAQPHYAAPDETEIFVDGQWVCTAFATDSERGRAVDRDEVAHAQQTQRQAAAEAIRDGRSALAQTGQLGTETATNDVHSADQPTSEAPTPSSKRISGKSSPSQNPPGSPGRDEDDDETDLFDMLLDE